VGDGELRRLLALGRRLNSERRLDRLLDDVMDTAVELTGAALKRFQVAGSPDEQAIALRDAMRVLFPEAVALVSAARQGFMRESG